MSALILSCTAVICPRSMVGMVIRLCILRKSTLSSAFFPAVSVSKSSFNAAIFSSCASVRLSDSRKDALPHKAPLPGGTTATIGGLMLGSSACGIWSRAAWALEGKASRAPARTRYVSDRLLIFMAKTPETLRDLANACHRNGARAGNGRAPASGGEPVRRGSVGGALDTHQTARRLSVYVDGA